MPPSSPTVQGPSPSPDPAAPRRPEWLRHAAVGLVSLGILIWAGRELGHRLPAIEQWIEGQGLAGWVVFIALTVVGTSLLVPDTVFAVMAGVLYGVPGGSLIITLAAFLTASLNFLLARRWLHAPVRRWLERQPRLAAIERAVHREGLKFLFLIRLTPLSPVAVSYLLGTTPTRFGPFLLACAGLIPGLVVEVYVGHVAKHVVHVAGDPDAHSRMHTGLTVAGLVLCLALMAYVTRIARRAIAEAEARDNTVPANHDGP
ncbi:MAG: VTT domain-containing protein [Verrucomicrobia bacterium]|nr:VTT domain-containing protein [Verrucomicrobiota bacterium]